MKNHTSLELNLQEVTAVSCLQQLHLDELSDITGGNGPDLDSSLGYDIAYGIGCVAGAVSRVVTGLASGSNNTYGSYYVAKCG